MGQVLLSSSFLGFRHGLAITSNCSEKKILLDIGIDSLNSNFFGKFSKMKDTEKICFVKDQNILVKRSYFYLKIDIILRYFFSNGL